MDDKTLGLWLLSGIGIFLLSMGIGYLAWNLGVRFLAWQLKKKAPRYANDARSAYSTIMVSMTKLGWITKKEAAYQSFNFGMDMWKAEEAGKRLEELNAKLAQLAKDLEEAGNMAQAELTAAHTELAGLEEPDIERDVVKRLSLPDDAFYLDHPFPEPAFVTFPGREPDGFVNDIPYWTDLENEHKHAYELVDTFRGENKQYFFMCAVPKCHASFNATPEWFWGKEAS